MKTRIMLHFTLFNLLIFGSTTTYYVAQETSIPPIMQIENPTASAVAWSPDGQFLAVGDTEGVSIYTRDLEFIRLLELPTEQMKTLSWSPDGSLIAAGGGNDIGIFDPDEPRQKAIYIWDTTNWELLTRYDEHEGYVPSTAWSPDGSLIASGSWDRTIRIWVPSSGETRFVLNAPEYPSGGYSREIYSISWGADSRLAARIGAVGVFVWSSLDGTAEELISIGPRFPPYPSMVVWSPDLAWIALGNGVYAVAEDREMYFDSCPGGFVWSPDSRFVAVLSRDGMVVCDPFSDTVVVVFEGGMSEEEVVFGYQDSLDWHPEGDWIAGAGGDGFVRIWDVSDLADKYFVNRK